MSEEFDARDFRETLRERLSAGIDDETLAKVKKQINDALTDAEDGILWSIKDNLASNIAYEVQSLFQNAVEAMLVGNEREFRRYIHADSGYTGRGLNHHFIGGHLIESGPTELRRQICDAYPDLLKNERILDLEEQVRALNAMLQGKLLEVERLTRRLNDTVRP